MSTAISDTHVAPRPPLTQDTVAERSRATSARCHLAWLAGGLVGAFLVPFVFADQLGMQRDAFYAIYVAFVVALFGGWMVDTGQSLTDLVRRRWRLALGVAAICAVAAAVMVINAESGGPHPGGLTFAGALAWRGVIYGAADGILLTAFPILVVYAAFGVQPGTGRKLRSMLAIGAVALAMSLLFTAVYHLGYADFRGHKVAKPMAGDLIWSPSTLLTANPVGAPLVHATMHVTAVAHDYRTDLFLPPH